MLNPPRALWTDNKISPSLFPQNTRFREHVNYWDKPKTQVLNPLNVKCQILNWEVHISTQGYH